MNTTFLSTFTLLLSLIFFQNQGIASENFIKNRVGYNISLVKVTPEAMKYAKSVGISSIEIGFGAVVEKDRTFKLSDDEIHELIITAKKAADEAGIEIWSIHMPFGQHIDLSLRNENH